MASERTRSRMDQLQIERLHELLGTDIHKIDESILETILNTKYFDTVSYKGKNILVDIKLKALIMNVKEIINREKNEKS